jgi:hypothetical protein
MKNQTLLTYIIILLFQGTHCCCENVPFPNEKELTHAVQVPKLHFQERFGLNLPDETNVVIFLLEAVRRDVIDTINSSYFEPSPPVWQTKYSFTPCSYTVPALFSMMTGFYSYGHKPPKSKYFKNASLPSLFKSKGYEMYFVDPGAEWKGQVRFLESVGFNVLKSKDLKKKGLVDSTHKRNRWGWEDRTRFYAAKHIVENSQKPFFMVLQFSNTHGPFFNPEPDRFNEFRTGKSSVGNSKISRKYLDALDYTMDVIDQTVKYIEESGLLDNTLIILMSDHGKSFGEHGAKGHGNALYCEQIRIPLIFRHPIFSKMKEKLEEKNEEITTSTLLDFYPSLSDLFGFKIEKKTLGRSFFDVDFKPLLHLEAQGSSKFGVIFGNEKWMYFKKTHKLFYMNHDDTNIKPINIDDEAQDFIDFWIKIRPFENFKSLL